MDGEMLRLIQTLNTLDGPANITEIVAGSGLSRGKVLGNLPKLCMVGFVDKQGSQYYISEKGRTVLGELESVPENKGFHFYIEEGVYMGLTAYSLKDFHDIIRTVDVKSIEFHMQRKDFENWVREVLRDGELASEIAEIGNSGVLGESLQVGLYEAVDRNYKMLSLLITH